MSYKPPFARMRAIKRDAPPPIPRNQEPASVEVALANAPEPVFVVEAPEPVEPEPGVSAPEPIEVEEPEVSVEPEPVEPEPIEVEDHEKAEHEDHEKAEDHKKLKFNPQMKKAELLALAEEAGLVVDDTMTKNQILSLLQEAASD